MEYGQSMMMGIFGVELLNQGQGISVDDMVTGRKCLGHLKSNYLLEYPKKRTISSEENLYNFSIEGNTPLRD